MARWNSRRLALRREKIGTLTHITIRQLLQGQIGFHRGSHHLLGEKVVVDNGWHNAQTVWCSVVVKRVLAGDGVGWPRVWRPNGGR